MKRTLSGLLCLLMLLPLGLGFSAVADAPNFAPFTITPTVGEGVVIEWENGIDTVNGVFDQGYFIPSETVTLVMHAHIEEGFTYNERYSAFFNGDENATVIISDDYRECSFQYNFVTGRAIAKAQLDGICVFTTADRLPRLDINIDIPFSNVTKEEWVMANFTLTLGSKRFESGDFSGTGSVKGRGNTSWGQPKKPYSIKLDSKASLLDIPLTKKYAIVASYSDPSLMRNYITYKSGLALDGIGYTPKCEFVDVYLNGVYNGIYILVERIDIESSKVDIEEATADNLTGGYLIEKDAGDKIDYNNDLWFNAPFQSNPSHDVFTLKAPEPDDPVLAGQMLDYLENYMQELHDAIMRGDESYLEYVDVNSWVDFLIMQELSKNIDGNLKTSCYMYKEADDNTLYMTALWDFDFAYGNADWHNGSSNNDWYDCPTGLGTSDFMVINSSCPWYKTLYENYPAFREAVVEKYAQYRRTLIEDMLVMVDMQAAYLQSAAIANDSKWNNDSMSGASNLKSWLIGRIAWLDRQWLPEEVEALNSALNVVGGQLDFISSGDYPWYGVITDGRSYARASNSSVDSSQSVLALNNAVMNEGDTLSFSFRVSSESNYDFLRFKVNDNIVLNQSGEVAWTEYVYTAPASGVYSFTWVYEKDFSESAGEDCAYIDDVILNTSAYQTGDVDMDGSITTGDALIILRYSLGLITLDAQNIALADMDGNDEITTVDALILLRRIMTL